MFHRLVLQQQSTANKLSIPHPTHIATQLQKKIAEFNSEAASEKQFLDWNVCRVSLMLIKIFEAGEAIPLPDLHAKFCDLIKNYIINFPDVKKTLTPSMLSPRWLLSSISNHVGSILGIISIRSMEPCYTERMVTY
jgi:hypothetical protein